MSLKNKNPKTEKTERTAEEQKLLLKRKKTIAIIFVVITLLLAAAITYYVVEALKFSNGDAPISDLAVNFKNLIQSYGNTGVLVALGIQILQVIVSPIPGGVIELGLGLCFGWFWGTVICLVGVAVASAVIMYLVKKWGIKIVELFVSTEKINELKFIKGEKKLERFVFLIYLIPGTPKDPLIFFFGLTRISISNFVIISTLARLPCVVTSTMSGKFLADKNYLGVIILFIVMGILALLGIIAYKKILERLHKRKELKKSHHTDD